MLDEKRESVFEYVAGTPESTAPQIGLALFTEGGLGVSRQICRDVGLGASQRRRERRDIARGNIKIEGYFQSNAPRSQWNATRRLMGGAWIYATLIDSEHRTVGETRQGCTACGRMTMRSDAMHAGRRDVRRHPDIRDRRSGAPRQRPLSGSAAAA
jgi:hypothetical protein